MSGAAARPGGQRGYAMAVLLVMLAVMGVAISVAMPVWRTAVQREKEEELIFRGRQYARAIGLFQRRFANAYPPSIDVLVEQKFLRKKYKDPMTEDGEFQVLYQGSALALSGGRGAQTSTSGRQGSGSGAFGAGATTGAGSRQGGFPTTTIGERSGVGPRGGVIGVASKSTEKSFRILDGRSQYNEWQFIWMPPAFQPGRGGGANQPGVRSGGRGGPSGLPGQGRGGPFGYPGQGSGGGRQPGSGRGPGR